MAVAFERGGSNRIERVSALLLRRGNKIWDRRQNQIIWEPRERERGGVTSDFLAMVREPAVHHALLGRGAFPRTAYASRASVLVTKLSSCCLKLKKRRREAKKRKKRERKSVHTYKKGREPLEDCNLSTGDASLISWPHFLSGVGCAWCHSCAGKGIASLPVQTIHRRHCARSFSKEWSLNSSEMIRNCLWYAHSNMSTTSVHDARSHLSADRKSRNYASISFFFHFWREWGLNQTLISNISKGGSI